MLKALDRAEAFLQQAAAAPPVRRAYPVSMEEIAPSSSAGESANPDAVRTMVQAMVQETVPWQEDNEQDEEEDERQEVSECARSTLTCLSSIKTNLSANECPGSTKSKPDDPGDLDRQTDRLGFSRGFVF